MSSIIVAPLPESAPHLEEVTVPIRESAPLGAPCWIDLTSSDLGRAQEFYGTVFGWTFEDKGPALGGYILAAKDGHTVAGMGTNVPQWPFPDGWSTYFHTADIDATVSASTAAGASLLFKPMRLPATGVMSASADPSGAVFRLWQPLEARGYELMGEPGAPAWHQLTTRDFPAAIDFYRDVLGWHAEPSTERDDFRYTTATFDGQQLLSVMDGAKILPEGAPSQWSIFFGTEDLDKTLQTITEAGGTVLQSVEDAPFGRVATAGDPTGATFSLTLLHS